MEKQYKLQSAWQSWNRRCGERRTGFCESLILWYLLSFDVNAVVVMAIDAVNCTCGQFSVSWIIFVRQSNMVIVKVTFTSTYEIEDFIRSVSSHPLCYQLSNQTALN